MAEKEATKESEKVLEKKLRVEVWKIGGITIKLPADYMKGVPDRMCLFPGGRIAFVEVKTTGEKPRAMQTFVHYKFQNLGFDVRVLEKSEQITKLIEDYAPREPATPLPKKGDKPHHRQLPLWSFHGNGIRENSLDVDSDNQIDSP